jgi:hypothetical protein
MNDIQTILEIGSPRCSLIPGTANVIDAPFHTPIAARRYAESMLNNSHCLQTGLENIGFCGKVKTVYYKD